MEPAPLPAELGPVFTVTAAASLGVPYHRTRITELTRPCRGVRARAAAELSPVQRLAALQQVLPESAVFSHLTAAYLWYLPVVPPTFGARDVHVTVPRGVARVRREEVWPHVADRPSRTLRGPLRATELGSTWCDLAADLSLVELVQCGDAILNRTGWDIARLQGVAAHHPARRGRTTIRLALPLLRPGSASPRESLCRLLFHEWRLPEPELNPHIRSASGWVATVDFLWREQRVIAEYYGAVHGQSWKRDLDRVALLEDAGYRVVVITGDDLLPRRLPALQYRLSALLSR